MIRLLLVSLIWAASFSLIKTHLVAVDPDVVNGLRLLLTLAVFLPFLRWKNLSGQRIAALMALGALQFGLMYALYTRSYGALKAYEVALATVMTPLYVTLLDDLLERRLRLRFLASALLAALGTAVSLGVLSAGFGSVSARGLLLVQGANLCFAVGQIAYRRLLDHSPGLPNLQAFPWCTLGAALVATLFALPALARGGLPPLSPMQLGVLAYLGVVASGLCFFLWNAGARRVNTGTLAVMNDLKIPLGMLVAFLFFGEQAPWPRLSAGLALIGLALALASVREKARPEGGLPESASAT